MTKSCLYCNLPLPDTADFCPQCGRPIERGFEIRSIQEAEFDNLRKEMEGKDVLPGQPGFYSDSIKTGKLENNKMLAATVEMTPHRAIGLLLKRAEDRTE